MRSIVQYSIVPAKVMLFLFINFFIRTTKRSRRHDIIVTLLSDRDEFLKRVWKKKHHDSDVIIIHETTSSPIC